MNEATPLADSQFIPLSAAEACADAPPLPFLSAAERLPNPALAAEGWERRFMADGLRLAEYTELYTSMGYEVRTEKVPPEEIGPECGDCRLLICRQFVTLYTRKRS
jgi:hypothetical protein